MPLETQFIQNKVSSTFNDAVFDFKMLKDIFSFEVKPDAVHDVIKFLKTNAELNFHFLTDLTAIHFPDNDDDHQFSIVYHLHNWVENTRLLVKTYLNQEPAVDSIIDLFKCANWMEREAWDFYGVNFKGHPQLKRILNMDEMVSHPMRKEFPMEDSGRTDKDDRFFGRTIANK